MTNDKALVQNLGLDYQVVFAGSEAASITQFQQFAKQQKPFLTYCYEPQWLFAKVPMTEVKLPTYKEGCDADPAKINCDYPETELKKIASTSFRGGSPAVGLVQNFSWTNDDQNLVAKYISDDGMSPRTQQPSGSRTTRTRSTPG